MGKLPANAGWGWVKQGFDLFRRQPGGLFMLFLGYMLAAIVLRIVPVLGQLMSVILVPMFAAIFMQGCADIEQDKRITPRLLLIGFRKPAFYHLAALGLLYVLAAGTALAASTLVDDGVFWKMITGQLPTNSPQVQESNAASAMLTAMLIYLPALMGFCFAAPLILWQDMSVGKAIFYSFFSVWRSLSAFIVFMLSWFGITLLATQLVLLFLGQSNFGMLLLSSLLLVLTLVIQCSLYAAYRQLFGTPQQAGTDVEAP